MSTESELEGEAFRIAVASISRHSIDPMEWRHTTLAALHPAIPSALVLAPGELAIASAFFSKESWYAFTTRRVAAQLTGTHREIDPRYGITYEVGNFKGVAAPNGESGTLSSEIGTVVSARDGAIVRFEFETGNASMAPLYACIFWSRATRFTRQP